MMDLNDCLRAVETGTSGTEEAEWLEDKIAKLRSGKMKWGKRAIQRNRWASTWKQAAKWYWRTSNEWGDMLDSCHEYIQKRRAERDEARTWAIRRTLERDKLQAELDARDERRCETCRQWNDGKYTHDLGRCKSQIAPHRDCINKGLSEWEAELGHHEAV